MLKAFEAGSVASVAATSNGMPGKDVIEEIRKVMEGYGMNERAS